MWSDIVFLLLLGRPLYERVLGFVNGRTNFDLKAEGQEGFTIIQYNVDDEYTYVADACCMHMLLLLPVWSCLEMFNVTVW